MRREKTSADRGSDRYRQGHKLAGIQSLARGRFWGSLQLVNVGTFSGQVQVLGGITSVAVQSGLGGLAIVPVSQRSSLHCIRVTAVDSTEFRLMGKESERGRVSHQSDRPRNSGAQQLSQPACICLTADRSFSVGLERPMAQVDLQF